MSLWGEGSKPRRDQTLKVHELEEAAVNTEAGEGRSEKEPWALAGGDASVGAQRFRCGKQHARVDLGAPTNVCTCTHDSLMTTAPQ